MLTVYLPRNLGCNTNFLNRKDFSLPYIIQTDTAKKIALAFVILTVPSHSVRRSSRSLLSEIFPKSRWSLS